MARIRGPLFSETAAGTFNGALTFSRRAAGQQVRTQRAQSDYENAARQAIRNAFRYGMILWRALPSAEKKLWNDIEMKGFVDV